MTWPNQLLLCEAYRRLGLAGEPLTWYISQPAKCGPLTFHRSRFPSADRMNAPFRVPTSTRTPLIPYSFRSVATVVAGSLPERATRSGSEAIGGDRGGQFPPGGGSRCARSSARGAGGRGDRNGEGTRRV